MTFRDWITRALFGEPLSEDMVRRLSPFFASDVLARVRLFPNIPWHVRAFGAITPTAYTSGYRVYLSPSRARDGSPEYVALLAHEIAHCLQYRECGIFRFRVSYLRSYFQNRRAGMGKREAYEAIPFECDAREIQKKVFIALNGQQSLDSPQRSA